VTDLNDRPASKAAVAIVFCLAALILLGALAMQSGSATDFVSYYVAGKTLLKQPHDLYSIGLQMEEQARAVANDKFLPWAHPATEALIFAPLSLLPYRIAFTVWAAINLMLLGLVGYLLKGYVAELEGPKRYALLGIAFWPILAGLSQGQDHILILLAYVLAFLNLKKGNEVAAGCFLGLGLIRFQLTLPLLLFFLVVRRWKVIGGAALVVVLIAATSFAIVGRGLLAKYLFVCRYLVGLHDPHTVDHMPTVRGLLTMMFPGSPHLIIATAVLSLVILAWGLLIWTRWSWEPASRSFDLLFALAVVISLAIDYHAFIYEMAAIVLPSLLVLRQIPRSAMLLWLIAAATFLITFAGRGLFCILVPFLLALAGWIATELRRAPSGERSGQLAAL
jgi:hypothetical protein